MSLLTAPASPFRLTGPWAVVRFLALTGLLGLGVVTLSHPSATRIHTWPWVLVASGLWIFPVVLLCFVVIRMPMLRLPGALAAALGLLAVATVASAAASPFAAASLAMTWPTLGGVALCLLLYHWLTEPGTGEGGRADQIASLMAAGGAVIACASLAAWLRAASPSLWTTRNTFPFGHSTYTGGFIVLIFPWLVQRAWAGSGARRAGWSAAALAALLALAGTSSRGAVAGLGVVGLAGMLVALRDAAWTRRQKILLVAVVVVAGAVAVGANPRLRELVLRRSWGDSARESNRQRSAMVDAGYLLGRQRPLLGWGPGSIPLAYPQVRAQLEGGVDNVLQLHSAPLQLWATLGAAGAAALVLLLGGAVLAVRRALHKPGSRAIALTAVASLLGYGVFALTDHQFDLPIIASGAVANLALLAAASPGRAWQPTPLGRFAALAGAVMLVAAPGRALLRDLRARCAYDAALAALETPHSSDALAALDRATALTPHDPYYQHQAAAYLWRARETETDPSRRAELTRAAVVRLEASLATGVHTEFAHFNLGWLQLERDSPAAAARHFAAAARLVPDKGGVYFGLGLALMEAGRHEDAVRAFALEWINDPRQLTSPAWEVPTLAAHRPAIRAEMLRLFAGLRSASPAATRAEAWTRWWLGEAIPPVELDPGFTTEATAFAATLVTGKAAAIPAAFADQPWARLYAAWCQAGTPGVFTRLTAGDAPLAAALARRAARHRDSFQNFLTSPTEDEPALLRTSRRERPGYGVLARHPEGPILADLYVVQENRVPTGFARELFPPKGWLPGRFLLALLPPPAAPFDTK